MKGGEDVHPAAQDRLGSVAEGAGGGEEPRGAAAETDLGKDPREGEERGQRPQGAHRTREEHAIEYLYMLY